MLHKHFGTLHWLIREVSFCTGRGAPENWGDQVLFLRSNGGSKDLFKLIRGDHLYFFKRNKIIC